jgi:hypothetical protein
MYITHEYRDLLIVEKKLVEQIQTETDSKSIAALTVAMAKLVSAKLDVRIAQRKPRGTLADSTAVEVIDATTTGASDAPTDAGAEPKQIAQPATTPEIRPTVPTTPTPDQSHGVRV